MCTTEILFLGLFLAIISDEIEGKLTEMGGMRWRQDIQHMTQSVTSTATDCNLIKLLLLIDFCVRAAQVFRSPDKQDTYCMGQRSDKDAFKHLIVSQMKSQLTVKFMEAVPLFYGTLETHKHSVI